MSRLYICVPNYRGWIEAPHHTSMLHLFHHLGSQQRDFVFLNPNNTILTQARQYCVNRALEDPDCDRVLFVDDDMVFGHEQFQQLEDEFSANDLDFLCALAFSNSCPTKPCVFGKVKGTYEDQPDPWWHIITDYPKGQRFPVYGSGFGMVLVSKRLLDKMRRDDNGEIIENYQHFKYPHALCPNEDVSFCLNANKKGAYLWCDSRVAIGHISKERPIICEGVYDMYGSGDFAEYGASVERMKFCDTNPIEAEPIYDFSPTPCRFGVTVDD